MAGLLVVAVKRTVSPTKAVLLLTATATAVMALSSRVAAMWSRISCTVSTRS